MPPNNSELRAETDPGNGGCLFTGPTAIRLNTGTPPTMDVISPLSKVINARSLLARRRPVRDVAVHDHADDALPSNGIVYVQTCRRPGSNFTSGTCGIFTTTRRSAGRARRTRTGRTRSASLRRFDVTPTSWYGCTAGDVFLHGTLDGRLTIAAENNIVLFGDRLRGGQGATTCSGSSPTTTSRSTTRRATRTSRAGAGRRTATGRTRPGGPRHLQPATPGSSSTTKSLFSGTTPGTSTIATQVTTTALRNPTFSPAPILTVARSFRVQTLPVRRRRRGGDLEHDRGDRPEVPGDRLPVRLQRGSSGGGTATEELHVRPAAEVRLAAEVPEPGRVGVAGRHLVPRTESDYPAA